jgi:hypothetical protein
MKKIRIYPTPSSQYSKLRKFVNTLFASTLHGHSRKTLILITYALIEVRRAILSELAREIPIPIHFKHRLRRLWRFCAKTSFDYQTPCQVLTNWVLTSLKDRQYLEIILDWTQIFPKQNQEYLPPLQTIIGYYNYSRGRVASHHMRSYPDSSGETASNKN